MNLYHITLSQIIHRVELKIPSARRCCPNDTLCFCPPKLVLKVPDEGEKSSTSSRKNSSHNHIQILQLHSAQNSCFYFRGICLVHVQLQVLLFYPRIKSALWRKIFTTSQRVHFPKGKCQIFVSHSTHISDFGLWGMLLHRLQVSFKLKSIYLL